MSRRWSCWKEPKRAGSQHLVVVLSESHLTLLANCNGGSNDLVTVIVMTFWYVLSERTYIIQTFLFYFHLRLITTPHVLHDHMTYVYSLSYVFPFTRYYGQEKSLSYYDLLDFGVLIYGRPPTLISLFLLNYTTPILAIDVLVMRTDLEKDPSWTRRVEIRQIPTVRRRTVFGPD